MSKVMFNNPFGSFQDTVAAAKEEREQLDRLLTISTPRERLLVVAIAGLLLILAAWVFLGSVARDIAVEGVLVEADEILVEDRRTVRAVVWVKADVAPHIETGMPALIELAMTDGRAGAFEGRIARVAAVPLPEGLAGFESAVPESMYRLDITMEEDLEADSLAGRECRIAIQPGRQAPLTLLGIRRQ